MSAVLRLLAILIAIVIFAVTGAVMKVIVAPSIAGAGLWVAGLFIAAMFAIGYWIDRSEARTRTEIQRLHNSGGNKQSSNIIDAEFTIIQEPPLPPDPLVSRKKCAKLAFYIILAGAVCLMVGVTHTGKRFATDGTSEFTRTERNGLTPETNEFLRNYGKLSR